MGFIMYLVSHFPTTSGHPLEIPNSKPSKRTEYLLDPI